MWSVSQQCTIVYISFNYRIYEIKMTVYKVTAVCYLNKTKITQLKSDIKLDYFHPDIWIYWHEEQHKLSLLSGKKMTQKSQNLKSHLSGGRDLILLPLLWLHHMIEIYLSSVLDIICFFILCWPLAYRPAFLESATHDFILWTNLVFMS